MKRVIVKKTKSTKKTPEGQMSEILNAAIDRLNNALGARLEEMEVNKAVSDYEGCRIAMLAIAAEGVIAHPASAGWPAEQIAKRVVGIANALVNEIFPGDRTPEASIAEVAHLNGGLSVVIPEVDING